MKSICVFLGAQLGNDPAFQEAAAALGRAIAERNHCLVYGGAKVGLMNILAESALNHGGKVIGVMSEELHHHEVTHDQLSELYVTKNMSERIQKQIELSDAFIAFPGGIGTLDELLKVWVLKKVTGLHDKKIGILNLNGIFTPFLSAMQHLKDHGFMETHHLELILSATDPESLLDQLILENTL